VGCSAPGSPIHEVDAVLAGGRATATTNSCTGNRDKAPGEVLAISGANWFSRRGRTCRLHAIYEPTVCLYGESGRNCQVWLGAPSSPGNSRSPQESEMVDPSRCTITCSPLENASTFSESIRPTLALRTPRSIEQAQKIAELAQAVRLPTAFQRRERRNARSDGGP
jgi:hypothetical protein